MRDQGISDYSIVTEEEPADFVATVKKAIADGWQPYGAAHYFENTIGEDVIRQFTQTLVKYSRPK